MAGIALSIALWIAVATGVAVTITESARHCQTFAHGQTTMPIGGPRALPHWLIIVRCLRTKPHFQSGGRGTWLRAVGESLAIVNVDLGTTQRGLGVYVTLRSL